MVRPSLTHGLAHGLAVLCFTALAPSAEAQFVYRFDMGPAGSPVATDARPVNASSLYTTANRYGWVDPAAVALDFDDGAIDQKHVFLDQVAEEALLQDGVSSQQDYTFRARLFSDTYRCVVTLGRIGDGINLNPPLQDLEVTANGTKVVLGDFSRLARSKATFDDAWGGYKRRSFLTKSDAAGILDITFHGQAGVPVPVLGIEFQSYEPEPVAFDHVTSSLVAGPGYGPVLQSALDLINSGDYNGARAAIDAITGDDLAQAWGYAWLAGWFTGAEADVDTALLDTIENLLVPLPAGSARDALLADLRLFRAGELFVRNRAYSLSAYPENPDSVTGLINNSCAGIQLLEQLQSDVLDSQGNGALPQGPFHAKAAYLIARNMYGRNTNWILDNSFTGQDFRPFNTYALSLLSALWQRLDPAAPGSLYPDAHEQITLAWFMDTFIPAGTVGPLDKWDSTSLPPIDFSATWWESETEFDVLPGHQPPVWADYQRRYSRTLRNAARWWSTFPQNRGGQLGGGLGDDSEAAALIVPNVTRTEWPENSVETGWRDVLDAHLYGSAVDPEQGYHIVIIDAEHGSEFTSYPLFFLMPMNFGGPKYIEYAMRTMRNQIEPDNATRWTDSPAWSNWRHWRTYHHAAHGIGGQPRDITENMKVALPGFALLDYNNDPDLGQAWYELGRAWAEAAMRTDLGKPAGILPPSVNFNTSALGNGTNWYTSQGPNGGGVGKWYFEQYYQMFVASRGQSPGSAERIALLEPLATAIGWLFNHPTPADASSNPPVAGTDDWIAWKTHSSIARMAFLAREDLLSEASLAVNPVELEWVIDNEGTFYTQYLNMPGPTKAKDGIEDLFELDSVWLRHFYAMATKTVLYTDRIKLGVGPALHGLYATQSGTSFNVSPTYPVTWFNPDPSQGELDLALLVHDVNAGAAPGQTTVTALVFNFGATPVDVGLRMWRGMPFGTYTVRRGPDTNEDDIADSVDWTLTGQPFLDRGAEITLSAVPPGVLQVIELALESTSSGPSVGVADIAVGPDDLRMNGPVLELEVHNIGAADFDALNDGNGVIRFYDDDTGAVLGGVLCPSPIAAPQGLNPSSTVVAAPFVPAAGQRVRVAISFAPTFEEITSSNNGVTVQF